MTQSTEIEIIPATVLPVIETLNGRNVGVKVGELVELVTGEETNKGAERRMRAVIVALRMDGLPICATPDDGYFWGITSAELSDTVHYLTRRSMTGLTQAGRFSKNLSKHGDCPFSIILKDFYSPCWGWRY